MTELEREITREITAHWCSESLSNVFYENYCSTEPEGEARRKDWAKFDDMPIEEILENHGDYFEDEERSLILEIAKDCDNATVGDVYDGLSELTS